MAQSTKKTTTAKAQQAAAPAKKSATGGEGVLFASVTVEPGGKIRGRVPAAALRDLGVSAEHRLKFTRERKGVWVLTSAKQAAKKK